MGAAAEDEADAARSALKALAKQAEAMKAAKEAQAAGEAEAQAAAEAKVQAQEEKSRADVPLEDREPHGASE